MCIALHWQHHRPFPSAGGSLFTIYKNVLTLSFMCDSYLMSNCGGALYCTHNIGDDMVNLIQFSRTTHSVFISTTGRPQTSPWHVSRHRDLMLFLTALQHPAEFRSSAWNAPSHKKQACRGLVHVHSQMPSARLVTLRARLTRLGKIVDTLSTKLASRRFR